MTVESDPIAAFYAGPAVELPIHATTFPEDGSTFGMATVDPGITEEAVLDAATQIWWKVIEGHAARKGNTQFEVAVANRQHAEGGVVLFISTYSSSISRNKGNFWEFIAWSMLNPDQAVVYMASLGNGFTSALRPAELLHYATTGMLTHTERGRREALPTLQNAAGALILNSLVPNKLAGNSAGCIQGRAIACALPGIQRRFQCRSASHSGFDSRTDLSSEGSE